jgi:hypothetical protein
LEVAAEQLEVGLLIRLSGHVCPMNPPANKHLLDIIGLHASIDER